MKSSIFYDPRIQAMRCFGCGKVIPVLSKTARDQDALLQLKEALTAEHRGHGQVPILGKERRYGESERRSEPRTRL